MVAPYRAGMAEPDLRLAPHKIPRMRAAVERAIATLEPPLERLRYGGYIHEPWMGDAVSEEMRQFFNYRLMDAPDSPYLAICSYVEELRRVRHSLVLAEEHYRRTEGDNAELWGRV